MAKTVYRLTAARRRALRKAQLVSARKRKGKGKGKSSSRKISRRGVLAATGVGAAVVTGAAVYGRHKLSGSTIRGPFGSTATPISFMNKPLGRGTGLSLTPTSNSSAVITGQIRFRGKDKVLFMYNHKKIKKAHFTSDNIMSALFGKKTIDGVVAKNLSNQVKQLRPEPPELDQYEFNRQSAKAYDSSTKAVRKAFSNSYLGGRKNRISEKEVIRRVQGYAATLASKGIIINQDHKLLVTDLFRKQGI